jgi:hypothetical protein
MCGACGCSTVVEGLVDAVACGRVVGYRMLVA